MVPAVGLQLLSPPCPPSIFLSQTMPEMTEKTPLKKPHRKKNRETHNAVERHRKKKINAGINRIGELIPCSPALKQSKIMILDQAYKYITEMKRQNDELLLNGGNREQAEEIKKLRGQLDDLQKENARYIALLKANDICLYDDPTIHWKGNLKNAKVSVVIPSDQMQKKKGNLGNAKVSVVIPGDQVQKNIIVYSNGSQLGGNNQGASVQGITFNISHNLPKQTANVVPVQRTCNLVTPVTLSGIYSAEIKSGVETSVPPLTPGLPNQAKKTLEPSTSENEQRVLMAASAASSQNALEPAKMSLELQKSTQGEVAVTQPKNRQESSRLLPETGVPNISLSSRANTDIPHAEPAVVSPEEDSRNTSQESCDASVPVPTCIPSARLSGVDGLPSGSVGRSSDGRSGSGVPATSSAMEVVKTVTDLNLLPATTLEKWPFPSSSAIGTPGSKNMGSLARITSAGNTQTTWTTLQLAGNTVQPLNHSPSTVMAGLSNEPVNAAGATVCVPNRCSTTSTSLSNPPPADEQTPEQIVVTLPSCPSLPMQPLVAKTQVLAQLAGSLLPLNPAMQVIQMAQPVGSAVAASPANQNVIILQPPSATPCPPVLRAEVPNQTVSQQIVIIQTANQNPLSLFSAPPPPPPPVRVPVNGVSPAGGTSNSIPNASGPHTFGGKHLVHILPRPSSSPSSSSTQTLSVAVSNSQQLPQTVSLNGQLFALKPVKSCSGASDQAPMQIIQPTTSEDPNTNVALNTFGALANLNQSISQMAGQSCLQLSVGQPTNPSIGSSQPAGSNCVLLAATTTTTSSSTTENSLVTSVSHPVDDSQQKSSGGLLSSLGPKRPNKKASSKKSSAASSSPACRTNPCSKEGSKKLDSAAVEATAEIPTSNLLPEKMPVKVVSQSIALPQFSNRGAPNDASTSESHPKDRAGHGVEPAPAPDLNTAAVPPESAMPGQFTAVALDPQDTVSPSLQTSRPQTDNSAAISQLAEPPQCISTSPSGFSDLPTTTSQISGMSVTNNGVSAESISGSEASADCRTGQDCSISIQATDLLEGQGLTKMLSELGKEGEAVQKTFPVQAAHSNFSAQSAKTVIDSNDDLVGKQEDLLLMSTEGENLTQSHSCSSEPEGIIASRQADSPMSTSSGSSCGFSVASMLPDTCRENVPSSTSVNTCNSCTFSEPTDIVALAARAIFDQETLAKGAGAMPQTAAPKAEDVASLGREQPFKSHTVKDATQIETASSSFGAQNSVQMSMERSAEKQSCSLRVEMPNTDLLVSQSSSASSLSVNNLIHQSCIIHPAVSCSGLPLSSDQATVPAPGTPSMPATSYMSQSPGRSPALITEYAPEQLSALRSTAMQAPPQMREPHLKQPSQESRKDPAKRAAQDDRLLSAPKRQKQCPTAPLRLEGMALLSREADDIANQTQILVGQIPPNSSNSTVSVGSQVHAEVGHSRLFPTGNFVPPTLRQAEVQCNPQVSVSDQPGQAGQQHLPSLQHAPAQGMSHLHSNHLYIKQQQQQQAGQLRDRHHLYQLQHHIPHAETSLHSQAHSVHHQRVMHQEAQMQKKRSLIQAAQPTPLGLPQKHHGNEQARQKSGQPHPHHPQIQQMQQQQQHFAPPQPEKSCENPTGSRTHHSHPQSHLNPDVLHQQPPPPDVGNRQPGSGVSSEHVGGHGQMQRLMTSRALEQQMVSQPSIVSRPSDMTCAPHRQERNRVSSYSAEALIGKSPSNSEQRIGISIQSSRVPDQLEMRNYLDASRNKGLAIHNMQGRMSIDHTVGPDVQRLSECQTFKPSGTNQQPGGNFDVQSSRNSDLGNSMPSLRGMQTQAFRIAQNAGTSIDRQKRLSYPPVQGISAGNSLPPSQDNDNTCHQSFMQSLLAPHLGDQSGGSQRSISEHQRNPQCSASSIIEYNCPPARENIHIRRDGEGQNRESCDMSLGTINNRSNSLNIPFSSSSSSGDIQGRNTSPSVSIQKTNPMRMTESHGNKGPMNPPVSSNVHGVVRPALPHPPVSRGNAEQVPPSVRQPNPSVTQRSRHPLQDNGGSKIRQPERNRSGNQRHGNAFDPSLPHLPLSASGSMILGRQQPTLEKRGGIVRFMPDGPQGSNDSAAPDQHSLSQNFGFPFIPEGGMNAPINANASFIPPVTQPSATRTPALIPVDPQNTLPSFYPPYSPAHPPLSNDISIPYFPNQMFPNPGTEKPNGGGLNNRFGSILSPPRPVGFAQPSFPLLTDMAPMHMANSSHLSNFNLTSLFPEIATALPPDGSAISPLLSLANTSASDSSKQPSNRPAHNISHILGHDCSSAV